MSFSSDFPGASFAASGGFLMDPERGTVEDQCQGDHSSWPF